jgi:hypothetical protein
MSANGMVRGAVLTVGRSLPLYPRKQTQVGHRAMSVQCQERTHAAQQMAFLLDHLVGSAA